MYDSTQELVSRCQRALADGADFPTVWNEILKPHPMVIGPPIQTIRDTQPYLEIHLASGRRLIFDSVANQILAE